MSLYFEIEGNPITNDQLFLILGPCVIESEEITLKIAESLAQIRDKESLVIIFKGSFDKANRSSINSYRGPGIDKGLKILQRVKEEFGMPVLSDIHEAWQAKEVAAVLSVIQIPAFLCRQTDLLLAAGKTGLPINIKKGQFMAAEDMKLAVEKVRSTGNSKIMLTERGTFFGYRNLVVDFRNIPIMKGLGVPVIMDVTHSVQRPSAEGIQSGGDPRFIPTLGSAAIGAGADGIFMEVHPDPPNALSDGSNSLGIKKLGPLLIRLKKLYNVS